MAAVLDRINDSPANPVPQLETIEATNPCGEQPLAPNDACNLGSVNLAQLIDNDKGDVDWDELDRVSKLAARFLDDVIEVTEIAEKPPRLKTRCGALGKRGTVSCPSSTLTGVVEVGIEKRKHSGSLITATKLSEPLIADASLFLGVARGKGA